MVDIESVMARLHEDEALTTDLNDAEAQQLLQWAEAQLKQMVQAQTDEAAFDEIFGVLRQFVKQVNRVVGQRAALSAEEVSEQLTKLAESARTLNAGEIPAQALNASAQSLESVPNPSALIDLLTSWVAPRASQAHSQPASLLESPPVPPALNAPPSHPMIASPESQDLLDSGASTDDPTAPSAEG